MQAEPARRRSDQASGMVGDALISPCGTWRYRLDRSWDDDGPTLAFLMLNPSTADATASDATLRGCLRRAVDGGFGRLRVLNLFALRATDPAALRLAPDPVDPGNEYALTTGLADLTAPGDRLVCAWGNGGALDGRGTLVARRLRARRLALHHLGLTATGAPRHPLYVPRHQPLLPWRDP
ncbi:MAG: DUF1643 domain-containing protein [Gemmobacter sp.]